MRDEVDIGGRIGGRPDRCVGWLWERHESPGGAADIFSRARLTPVLALSKRNSNAAEIILFLHRLCSVRGATRWSSRGIDAQVLSEYFKELEEESIRDNFVIIYELLDEMMDFGYPQTTESKILQECVMASARPPRADSRYITQESHKLEVQARPPMAVTNAVSWRSEGIRYRKNEVFLDVIESVNLTVSSR